MDTITPFFAYAAALFIAAAIPGPGIAALVGQSLGGNARRTGFFMLGIALGDVTWLTVAIVGLAAVAKTFAGAFVVIKLFGALYLLYLAWGFWASDVQKTSVASGTERTPVAAMFAAYIVTLGNPKPIIFYLALLPSVLDLGRVGFGQWMVLSVLTVVVLFVALTPYAFLAAKARNVMSDGAALRKLNQSAAVVIGGAGALILVEATSALLQHV
ncbi:LysE family translocator [Halocynthiibacter namhaensis]|uniref:LysE family translocator n=1 Tax=Halocynthiibacter namhaensis TaxID=1290553 RepID=UPI00057933AB|nr:LysE family translocator [Halocynthiibacter namhaensis]